MASSSRSPPRQESPQTGAAGAAPPTVTTSPSSVATGATPKFSSVAKAWKKQYIDESNFPEWTKSDSCITMPLILPEPSVRYIGEETRTCCLFCPDRFDVPSQQSELLQHFLTKHHFVIGDVHQVVDMAIYLDFWRAKFESRPMTDYCRRMRCEVESKDKKDKEEHFFFLTGSLQEDRELRQRLHMRRLEDIVEIQEKERRDTSFSHCCLFCRNVFEGNHNELFNHMAFFHNFSVGQPNNLVFVKELLVLLESRLQKLICIFCEKTFKSRDVLKEHMRKKMHKKINPKNSLYDKYYMVNYQEFGRKWNGGKGGSGASDEDELPTGFDNDARDFDDPDDADDDRTWDDWKGEQGGAVCLFCEALYTDPNDLLNHMTSIHDFDFQDVRNKGKLNFYQQVKLVNFVRRQVHLNTCIFCQEKFSERGQLTEHMSKHSHFKMPEDASEWDQTLYLFPTYENDELLNNLDDLYDKVEEAPVEPEDIPETVRKSIFWEAEIRDSLLPKKRVMQASRPIKKDL